MRTWDPSKWDKDPSKFGQAGLLWTAGQQSGSLTDGRSGRGYNEGDPRYFTRGTTAGSEGSGGQSTWEPTDLFNQQTGNGSNVQIRDLSRLINQNEATWNDDLGWMTPAANYKSDDDWKDNVMEYLPAVLATVGSGALMGGAMGAGTSVMDAWGATQGFGGGAGSGGSPWSGEFGPGGGLDPETLAINGGGGTPAPWDGSFGSGGGLDPETAAGFGGGGSAPASGGGLMEMIQRGGSGLLEWGMKNPIQALSLLQTGAGLLGGSGGSGGSGGGGGSGNPITLPKGNRGAFQGNPFTQQQIQNFKYTGGR